MDFKTASRNSAPVIFDKQPFSNPLTTKIEPGRTTLKEKEVKSTFFNKASILDKKLD